MITALPDVRTIKLEPDVEFLVLACDGIWNSMTSQEVVDFVRPKILENKSLSEICEEVSLEKNLHCAEFALSAIIVKLFRFRRSYSTNV